MAILEETYQSIQKACWGNIPFKIQDVSLVGHNDPSHDLVRVRSSSRQVVRRFLFEYSGRYQYQVGR
jgi:hypothetical protein